MRSVRVRLTMHDLHGQTVPKKITDKFPEFSNSCQKRFLCLKISEKGLWLFGRQTSARIKNHEELTGFWQPSLTVAASSVLVRKHTRF